MCEHTNNATYTDLGTWAPTYFLTLGNVHPQRRTDYRLYVFEQFPTTITERIRRPAWCAPRPYGYMDKAIFAAR